jgi:hypothetical protein
MELDFAKIYKKHLASFKSNYLKNFEEDLKHAPNQQYFITIFQEKVKRTKSEKYKISQLHSKISDIDNTLELDDRISFIELVTKLCIDEKRDLLQTLCFIAEIKSLDEIWSIAEKRRKSIKESENISQKNKFQKVTNSPHTGYPTLLDIFDDSKKYDHVIKLLVSHDFCSKDPLVWVPQEGANKQILCALLYLLRRKNYYKLTEFPSKELLIEVAKNTFSIPLSKSTLKIKDLSKYERLFNFIPNSSEIK